MTVVKCGFYCENNENGLCKLEQLTITEGRTCTEFKFDASKAECGACEHWNEDGTCDIDGEVKQNFDNCHNGQFSCV